MYWPVSAAVNGGRGRWNVEVPGTGPATTSRRPRVTVGTAQTCACWSQKYVTLVSGVGLLYGGQS